MVGMLRAVDSVACADSLGVVGVAEGFSTAAGGGQLSAVAPAKCPLGSVVVTQGISDGICGDRFSVVGFQEISPGAVIGIAGFTGSPGIRRPQGNPTQLAYNQIRVLEDITAIFRVGLYCRAFSQFKKN